MILETSTEPPPVIPAPALWNPNAAACWSLLFSPGFGAFLHARNAQVLGRAEEAKANWVWFYANLGYFGLVLASTFVPKILPDGIFRPIAFGLLLGWYFSLAKKQALRVKATWGDNYQRKAWTRPLLIAFGCLLGFFVLAVMLAMVAESMGIE